MQRALSPLFFNFQNLKLNAKSKIVYKNVGKYEVTNIKPKYLYINMKTNFNQTIN